MFLHVKLNNANKFEELNEMNEMTETTENQSTINADLTETSFNNGVTQNAQSGVNNTRRHNAKNTNKHGKDPRSRLPPSGEKIQVLRNQIEKQMKDYVRQEEYEEVLKLLKKLNLLTDENWDELEQEVDRLDYTDIENKSSIGMGGGGGICPAGGATDEFITEDDIVALATDLNNSPYYSKSVNEIIELSRRNSELRQSTPFLKEDKHKSQGNQHFNHNYINAADHRHNNHHSASSNNRQQDIEMHNLKDRMLMRSNQVYGAGDDDEEEQRFAETSADDEQKIRANMIVANYGRKRSVLRKLMIAQRKQFLLRKEQADLNKIKNNLADTSISNFSQVSGHVAGGEDEAKKLMMNKENGDEKDENMRYALLFLSLI